MTQAPVNPGDSGGPLLDEEGAVVGIVVGSATETEGVYFAVAVQHVRELRCCRDDHWIISPRCSLCPHRRSANGAQKIGWA